MGSITSKHCGIALCAVCSLLLARTARAQVTDGQAAPGGPVEQNTKEVEKGSAPGTRYDEVTVTAAPLPRSLSELATPTDVLSGQDLQVQGQRTLGETLSREPGVSSTYFGPNASRPIIRGQGGEHIRIMNNGLSLLDASGTGVDHAVSLDPITLKRIDIVRGPAALLYGPTAAGGLVHTICHPIPAGPSVGGPPPRWGRAGPLPAASGAARASWKAATTDSTSIWTASGATRRTSLSLFSLAPRSCALSDPLRPEGAD